MVIKVNSYNQKKLNKLSFGYYKFISAGHFIQENNLFSGEKKIIKIFFSIDSYLFKKK